MCGVGWGCLWVCVWGGVGELGCVGGVGVCRGVCRGVCFPQHLSCVTFILF